MPSLTSIKYKANIRGTKTMKVEKTAEHLIGEDTDLGQEHEQIGSRLWKSLGTLNDAIAIAAIAHQGQRDKAGDPYILHPLRIMMRMENEVARIVGVLHDVVEDTREKDSKERWTLERLLEAGFSAEVIEALDRVTDRKHEGESYEEFVKRAAANPVSRNVKIADLEDNMNMLRLNKVGSKQLERLERYHRAWLYLMQQTNGQTNG